MYYRRAQFTVFDNSVHVFDCDGVLLDSNMLKLQALRETLAHVVSPIKFIDWAVEEFRQNFGRTRAGHFKVFSEYGGVHGYKLDPQLIDDAMTYYGRRVESLYMSCPVVRETESYISNKLGDKNLYVVSASNEDELRRTLPFRIPLFGVEAIFGGPAKKDENLKAISTSLGTDEIVFYGDSVQDAKAALQVGFLFVGLHGYSADPDALKDYCKEYHLLCFENCLEIDL